MYGVIDIGSNTIRLVVYKIENKQIIPLINKKLASGLAGYINKKNEMSKKGIEVAIAALLEFKEIIKNMTIEEVFAFATASLRNIANREQAISEIKKASGFDVRILSGEEEAMFDYYGAVQAQDLTSGILVDIGGGSTELVFYNNKKVSLAQSLPIGSLNLFSNYVSGIMPTNKELENIHDEVKKQLQKIQLSKGFVAKNTICGVGGTARAIVKILKSLDKIEKKQSKYEYKHLDELLFLYMEKPNEIVRQVLKIAPERIHTLLPGLVVLKIIADTYGIDYLETSSYGVREGFLYYTLEKRGELIDI